MDLVLRPYQERLATWLQPSSKNSPNSIAILWPPGTGKTNASLAPASRWARLRRLANIPKAKVIIFGPKEQIFEREINFWKQYQDMSWEFVSWKSTHTLSEKRLKELLSDSFVIMDEVHNAYNSQEANLAGQKMINALYKYKPRKLILVTATPMVHSYEEIVHFANFLFSVDNKTFTISDLDTPSKVSKIFKDRISYYTPSHSEVPSIDWHWKDISNKSLNRKLDKLDKLELNNAVSFYGDSKRSELLSDLELTSPKYWFALNKLLPRFGKQLWYHSKVRGTGINLIRRLLEEWGSLDWRKIDYAVNEDTRCSKCFKRKSDKEGCPDFHPHTYMILTGELTANEMSRQLKVFNSLENATGDIIRLVVGSRTIMEGVDFKSILTVAVLETLTSISNLQQVVGRAARNRSLSQLGADFDTIDCFIPMVHKSEMDMWEQRRNVYDKIRASKIAMVNASFDTNFQTLNATLWEPEIPKRGRASVKLEETLEQQVQRTMSWIYVQIEQQHFLTMEDVREHLGVSSKVISGAFAALCGMLTRTKQYMIEPTSNPQGLRIRTVVCPEYVAKKKIALQNILIHLPKPDMTSEFIDGLKSKTDVISQTEFLAKYSDTMFDILKDILEEKKVPEELTEISKLLIKLGALDEKLEWFIWRETKNAKLRKWYSDTLGGVSSTPCPKRGFALNQVTGYQDLKQGETIFKIVDLSQNVNIVDNRKKPRGRVVNSFSAEELDDLFPEFSKEKKSNKVRLLYEKLVSEEMKVLDGSKFRFWILY